MKKQICEMAKALCHLHLRERLIELLKTPHKAEKLRQTGTAIGDYEDDCIEAMIADFLLANGVIVPPCAVGDTVYHITTCEGFTHELDGSLYNSLGGLGDATGYYCPCELRDNCPFDNEEDFDCDNLKTKQAVFEDTVNGFFIGDYDTWVYLEYSGNVNLSDFGKTVFLTREEAEEALGKMMGAK